MGEGVKDAVRPQRSDVQQRLGHRPCHMSPGSSFTLAAQGHSISRWQSGVKLRSVHLRAQCLSSLSRYRREIAMGWGMRWASHRIQKTPSFPGVREIPEDSSGWASSRCTPDPPTASPRPRPHWSHLPVASALPSHLLLPQS